ncbi:MAG TPA: YciI family protein [Actinocrinis sp.]|uniref:YciI family protein n=1 Tax=Actinocrinis sp. TaxID=1920516 RepID=UPI002D74CE46|nr:YciI family protein [Actinocrinis sp.]HZU54493.1 YciI family protein [Actinocrinis sp.]
MRYMSLIKIDPAGVPEGGPSEELMTEMGKLIEEMTKAGVLLDTAGLAPLDESTRVQLSGGKLTVIDGPFTEAKEFVGGYALTQCRSKEEAIEWGKRFLAIHGDQWEIALEIREVQEAA